MALNDVVRAGKARYIGATARFAWQLATALPVAGASRPQHLIDAVAAVDLELTVEDIAALEEPYRPHRVEHDRRAGRGCPARASAGRPATVDEARSRITVASRSSAA